MNKLIAVIPARSGSKGLKDKNILPIGGLPLLTWGVSVCKKSSIVDEVYISTDSKKYETIATDAGARSLGLRSGDLASDKAKSVDVILDFLEKYNEDVEYLLLVQPTAPIRTEVDIENMVEIIEKNSALNAVVSVSQFEEPHPYKLKQINSNGVLASFIEGKTSEIPRQQMPKAFMLNGAFYLIKVSALKEHKTFFPPNTAPYIMKAGVNIDTEEDFEYLKYLVSNKKVNLP